jgi:biopolymer transport protein ExbB
MDMSTIVSFAGNACYGALGLVALWGAFCAILVWRRVAEVRFRSEAEQLEFLDQVDETLTSRDFGAAAKLCENDPRAVPQLAALAIANRNMGYVKVRSLLVDRFQRDVLADLEYRLSWVNTMIKSAPMLGLYGTVLGMMGAFDQLYAGSKIDPAQLAGNISVALITTAMGLTIAIPLIICTASINVRIRRMEDLVGYGLTRFLEAFKKSLDEGAAKGN